MKKTLSLQEFTQISSLAMRADCELTNSVLRVTWQLKGFVPDLVWPAAKPEGAFTTGLWQSTCFELFVKADSDLAYLEFNFSPSRDWAVFAFRSYREAAEDVDVDPYKPLAIVTDRTSETAQLTVELPAKILPQGPWHLGITAVIAEKVRKSYWALAHCRGKPDFHAAESFTLSADSFQSHPK